MPKQYRAKRVRTGNANRSSGGHRADRTGERDAAVRDAERRAAEAMRQNLARVDLGVAEELLVWAGPKRVFC
jgi:hypothetical protein